VYQSSDLAGVHYRNPSPPPPLPVIHGPSRAATPPPQAAPRFVAGEFGEHAASVGFGNAEAATDAAIQNLHTIADGVNLPENIKTTDLRNFSLDKGQLKVTIDEVTYYVLAKQGGTYLLGRRKWPEVFDAHDRQGVKWVKWIASQDPAKQKNRLDLWAAYEGLISLKATIQGLTPLPQNEPTATSTKELLLAKIDFLEKATVYKLGVDGDGLAVDHALLLAESLLSVAQPSPNLASQISVALNALGAKPSVKEAYECRKWLTEVVLLLNAAVLCGIYELKPARPNCFSFLQSSKQLTPDQLFSATTVLANKYKNYNNSDWATVADEIVKITERKLEAEVTEAAAEARVASVFRNLVPGRDRQYLR